MLHGTMLPARWRMEIRYSPWIEHRARSPQRQSKLLDLPRHASSVGTLAKWPEALVIRLGCSWRHDGGMMAA